MNGVRKRNISAEVMQKAWLLKKKGLSCKEISDIIECSYQSVLRIVEIMGVAEIGDFEQLERLYNGGYAAQKKHACQLFGHDMTAVEKKAVEPLANEQENLATCMVNILQSLASLNEKMALLLEELGVKGGRKA